MQVSDESIGSVYVDAQKITYDIVNNYLEKGKNDIIFVSPQQNLIRTVDLIEGMKKLIKIINYHLMSQHRLLILLLTMKKAIHNLLNILEIINMI